MNKAREKDKLLVFSIGYSACHWCHVMAHESFEDEEVAELMNRHFVSVKVDREERPDIDHIYMNAVQLLTGRGGWPLNCIALPDGRPVYAGTYYPKDQWMNLMEQLATLYRTDRQRLLEQAGQLHEGIRSSEVIVEKKEIDPPGMEDLHNALDRWTDLFDREYGGNKQAPKFPMPANPRFLLAYAHQTGKQDIQDHVERTLDRMIQGGIYDQLGGGFARYSVDACWKVPHFEKMLYDNAQLVLLYSEAYQVYKKDSYKRVVYETLAFLKREMRSPEGLYYSALDADSEGREGAYYTWTDEAIGRVLSGDPHILLFTDYFNVSVEGNWEEGQNVLWITDDLEEVAQRHDMDANKAGEIIEKQKTKLMEARNRRERPGTDDKSLTAWNALMISALARAYRVFGREEFLKDAVHLTDALLKNQLQPDHALHRSFKEGRSSIRAFLDDYALMISGMLELYQAGFDEAWTDRARELLDYCLDHFYDRNSGMFFYTAKGDKEIIAREMELSDNVIPSSNAVMATNLSVLSSLFGKPEYNRMARQMLTNVRTDMFKALPCYAQWGLLSLRQVRGSLELAILGDAISEARKAIDQHYLPGVVLAGPESPSDLPLLRDRYKEGKTLYYVCSDGSCQLPVENFEEAITSVEDKLGA